MSIIIGSEAVVGNKLVLKVLKSFFKKAGTSTETAECI